MYALPALAAADSVSGRIVILATHRGQPYDTFTDAIKHDLTREIRPNNLYSIVSLNQQAVSEQELQQLQNANLLITVGTHALTETDQLNLAVPTLATLIPRVSFEQIEQQATQRSAPAAARSSALFLDQPLERQLELIRIALPHVRKLGVITAAASQQLLPQLEKSAAAKDFKLVIRSISDGSDLGKALLSIMDDIDALLALPDPEVHNRFTAANILLTAYRKQVPVIGYSRAYVEAGALLAVYSTPHQIAAQVVRIVRASAADKWRLPAPQYPHEFEIKVNTQVARSLGLDIPPENDLRTYLMDIEAHNK